VQDRLVKMLAVCSMQLYCLRLGRLMEEGQLTDTIAAIAKMNNTRKAREVVAEARDPLGGNGILLDFHVMRHMAACKPCTPTRAPRPARPSTFRRHHRRRGIRLMTTRPRRFTVLGDELRGSVRPGPVHHW
jgi:alkylation response protein AidB-like acyl-CoA dehydrogenase